MEIFKVEIQEFSSKIIEVKALNSEEAIDLVREKYKKSEIVLDYDDYVETEFVDLNKPTKSEERNRLMKEIVDYLYQEEKRHYEESNSPDDHIFVKLERIQQFLH